MEGLRRIEVDARSGALRLVDSKTGESIRPTGRRAFDVLLDALSRTNSDFVFPSPVEPSKPYRGLPKAFKRIVSAKLPDLTPHKLRHAFASAAEDVGLSVPTIGALLGHADSGVTQGYIHKVDPVLVEAANRVADYIARSMSAKASNVIPLKERRA